MQCRLSLLVSAFPNAALGLPSDPAAPSLSSKKLHTVVFLTGTEMLVSSFPLGCSPLRAFAQVIVLAALPHFPWILLPSTLLLSPVSRQPEAWRLPPVLAGSLSSPPLAQRGHPPPSRGPFPSPHHPSQHTANKRRGRCGMSAPSMGWSLKSWSAETCKVPSSGSHLPPCLHFQMLKNGAHKPLFAPTS